MDDSQIYKEIVENLGFMEERIESLFKKSIKLKAKVDSLIRTIENSKLERRIKLEGAFKALEQISKLIEKTKIDIKNTIPLLKQTVRKDEFDKLSKIINSKKYEDYITEKELNNFL
jgi:regulator of replication initiation timing